MYKITFEVILLVSHFLQLHGQYGCKERVSRGSIQRVASVFDDVTHLDIYITIVQVTGTRYVAILVVPFFKVSLLYVGLKWKSTSTLCLLSKTFERINMYMLIDDQG